MPSMQGAVGDEPRGPVPKPLVLAHWDVAKTVFKMARGNSPDGLEMVLLVIGHFLSIVVDHDSKTNQLIEHLKTHHKHLGVSHAKVEEFQSRLRRLQGDKFKIVEATKEYVDACLDTYMEEFCDAVNAKRDDECRTLMSKIANRLTQHQEHVKGVLDGYTTLHMDIENFRPLANQRAVEVTAHKDKCARQVVRNGGSAFIAGMASGVPLANLGTAVSVAQPAVAIAVLLGVVCMHYGYRTYKASHLGDKAEAAQQELLQVADILEDLQACIDDTVEPLNSVDVKLDGLAHVADVWKDKTHFESWNDQKRAALESKFRLLSQECQGLLDSRLSHKTLTLKR